MRNTELKTMDDFLAFINYNIACALDPEKTLDIISQLAKPYWQYHQSSSPPATNSRLADRQIARLMHTIENNNGMSLVQYYHENFNMTLHQAQTKVDADYMSIQQILKNNKPVLTHNNIH